MQIVCLITLWVGVCHKTKKNYQGIFHLAVLAKSSSKKIQAGL